MSTLLDSYEQKLLEGWEDVYKKAQLTLWILLALKNSPKHMVRIKNFITKSTNGTIIADDKSMYRALRRFNDADIVNFKLMPNASGPDKKVYFLTPVGIKLLQAFLERNVHDVLLSPQNHDLIN
ncbi:MAG: PadR family transcriptional regulator [bacterium]